MNLDIPSPWICIRHSSVYGVLQVFSGRWTGTKASWKQFQSDPEPYRIRAYVEIDSFPTWTITFIIHLFLSWESVPTKIFSLSSLTPCFGKISRRKSLSWMMLFILHWIRHTIFWSLWWCRWNTLVFNKRKLLGSSLVASISTRHRKFFSSLLLNCLHKAHHTCYTAESILIPKFQRNIVEFSPDWNSLRAIFRQFKHRMPFLQDEELSTYVPRTLFHDCISTTNTVKHKEEEPIIISLDFY